MSVINQMLKDLEQRSPGTNSNTSQINNTALAHSPLKIALVTGFFVLAVCLMSFYIWQLITENNALKSEQIVSRANATEAKVTNDLVTSAIATKTVATKDRAATDLAISIANDDSAPTSAEVTKSQERISITETEASVAAITQQANSSAIANVPVNNNVSRVTPVKKVPAEKVPHLANTDSPVKQSVKPSVQEGNDLVTPVKSTKNQMSVSRRQLSADELADQKIALAEKALTAKQIEKAEQLLEDAIIIRPSDSQTRKKLAALWFGRQAYQDAVNLLSQGIALNNQDSSLRIMQARIYLKQGQVTSALNTLKPLAQLKDEQYQIMLANTAQQAQQSRVAVNAYKMLITMQPNIGRWHLGLAVLYDQNSQFTLASTAYKTALTKNDLSVSSERFVNDRIQAIGQ